jgi:hypothetical protein
MVVISNGRERSLLALYFQSGHESTKKEKELINLFSELRAMKHPPTFILPRERGRKEEGAFVRFASPSKMVDSSCS